MPYIGNVLTSFAVETGNINDQAVTAPKLSATGGTDGQVLALDSNLNLEWVSDPAGQWVTSGSNIYYNDGNVGIGTSTIDEHLHIEGSGSNERVKIENTTSGVAGLVLLNTNRRYDVQVNGSAFQIYDNTGSAERLRIDSSGRLLMGSSVAGNADADNINVAGSGNVGITFRGSTSGTGNIFFADDTSGDDLKRGQIVYDHSGNSMRLHTNAVERIRIDSSGRLLAGTSTALTSPTGSRVQVSGNDFATSSIRQTRYQTAEPGASLILSHARGTEASPAILADGDEVGKIRWHAYDGTDFECISAEIKAQIDGTIQENQSPSRLLFSTTASGASSPTERVRIDSSGNVGIGVSSLSSSSRLTLLESTGNAQTLEIKGANSGGAGSQPGVRFSSFNGDNIGGIFGDTNSDALRIQTGGTDRIYVTNAGNVGIGTSSPNYLLTALASSGSQNIFQAGQTGVSNGYTISSNGSALTHQWYAGSGEAARIDSSGRLLIGTSTSPSGGDSHAQKAPLLIQGRIGSDADSGRINLQRGSAASNGSSIGSISFTDSSNNIYARIESFGDATPGTDDYPGRITFSTTADGASSVTERMRIDRLGRVLIGSGAISSPKANTGGIDVSTHNIAIVFGGSSLSGTDTLRANNATKDGRIAAAHYANAEEPVGVIRVVSNSSENQLHWGGGSSIINAATDHRFYTASNNTTTGGSERMRILSGGGLTFNGDTAQANALDDYETGTWTPQILGGTSNPSVTYSSQSGAYEKIGNLVHASFFMNVSAVSSQGSGQFQVHGLPFNCVSSPLGASEVPAVCLQTEPFQDGDGDHRHQTLRTVGNNSFLLGTYKDQSSGGAVVPTNAAANIGTGYFIGHITYRTDS